ncbi:short-chain dehydrogenase [Caulobacter flavus]|uniref:Short-chain dehydrogenase n=1 Tax=Caulobacter flavus TaxID=1679497 RepID=A0A2N5CPI0_9CAUL|nr:SDR family oxidoreductase [Caulobacter flavus]AYV48446.1 short-chain dehydrogenase [Caulobacter flavus]PLR08838.1 short-chain dehydrogenase [Caulobacter flavus]
MTTVLITGANRGIGLEHVRQYAAAGADVVATCRDPAGAAELQAIAQAHPGKVRIEALLVNDAASVAALAERLKGVAVDVLINNAGTYGPIPLPEGMAHQTLSGMDYEIWADILATNVVSPFRITAALIDNVKASDAKTIVMMSSGLASIGTNVYGGSHAYRSSKAALNMLAKGLAVELKGDGVTVVAMAPGWTRTALGGPDAPYSVEESVAGQQKVIAGLGLDDTGRFLDLAGAEVAW